MTSQERIKVALAHREPDRVPIHDSVWNATVDRWKGEGLPPNVPVAEYFGFEMSTIGFDDTPGFPIRAVEKTDEFITETTPYGGLRRHHRDRSTTPELLDHAVKSPEDWYTIKKRLEPDYTRVDWISARRTYQTARHDGKFVLFSSVIGYSLAQRYIRSDELLMLLLTDPGLVRDMYQTQTELVIGMARLMLAHGFAFDAAFLMNDMGYRGGPLFSPKLYRELQFDLDRQLFDFFHANGMRVILHSCGCVKAFIPHLIEAGLDCLQALEVKAGMDLLELKREFGNDLAFMGGIDVRLMADPDPSKIEAEIARKFEVAKKGGGYIYHSDHSVPKNVSFPQYCHVMELVRAHGAYR
ncbi:MAG: hypothetical protein HYY04_04265 [Chloroflexi bacterium]|nr:hypothetical protein [Chloroflexota bacterium]